LPFIVASPQCPADSYWLLYLDDLKALIDDLVAHYLVDVKRIYLTGLSMGGTGTWTLAAAYPEIFAAIAPICGRSFYTLAKRLKDLPAWVFHGEDDEVIPADESRQMTDALNEVGADIKLTLYPGVGHNSWTRTYDNPELYDWFLSHSR
jgi:predicted peptidase